MGRSACATDQYDVLEVIGKGSFGVVSKIRRKEDGKVRNGNPNRCYCPLSASASPLTCALFTLQVFVWKELNYGHMSEKEKLLVVSEVRMPLALSVVGRSA